MPLTAKQRQLAIRSIRAYKASVMEGRELTRQAGQRDGQGVPPDRTFFFPEGRDGMNAASYLSDPFARHANFFSVVSALAWSFIQAPFQLGRWGEDNQFVPEESHPLDKFFRQPNGLCSGPLMWWLRMIYMSTVGEAFLVLDRKSAHQIPNDGWLYPGGRRWRPTESVDPDGMPSGWIYEGNEKPQAYFRHELVYWRYPRPGNPLRGLSPAEPSETLLLADVYADRYQISTMRNNGKPDGILKNKQIPRVTDAQFEQVRDQWDDRHKGPDMARSVAVMTGGWEYEALAWSPQDLEYLEQRRYTREQLCGVFRVPKWMLSSTDDINRAISAEMRAAFWEDVIASHHTMALADLETQLLVGIDPTLTARFLLDDVPAMVSARRERWKSAQDALKSGVSLREANRQFDLGIDTTKGDPPGYDTVYKPSGMQVVAEDGSLVPVAPMGGPFGFANHPYLILPPGAQTAGEIAQTVDPIGVAAQVARSPIERAQLLGYENSDAWRNMDARAKLTWAQRRQQWNRWMKAVREPADEMVAASIQPWFESLSSEILKRFNNIVKERAGSYLLTPGGSRNGHARADEEGEFPEDRLDDVFPDVRELNGQLISPIRESATEIAKLSSAYTSGELGPFAEIDLLSPSIQEFLDTRMNLLSNYKGSIPEEIRKQLSEKLQAAFAEGQTIQEMRSIVKSFGEALSDPVRTLRIARTEAGTLANGLRYAVAENFVDAGEWLTAGLGNSRPTHEADEKASTTTPVPIGTRFPNTNLLYPQEPGGPPEEVINCSCLHILVPRTS